MAKMDHTVSVPIYIFVPIILSWLLYSGKSLILWFWDIGKTIIICACVYICMRYIEMHMNGIADGIQRIGNHWLDEMKHRIH